VGRLWRSHSGPRRAGRGEAEKGVLGAFLFFPPLLMARVGAVGAGLDCSIIHEYGYRVKTHENSEAHSNHDFLDFCLSGARHNARKRFKFEFLKIFTLGGQHIGQGFQEYFCYKEITYFAKFYISKFGIVTVSDSKFG
jgi:hypothetical protein